VFEVGCEGVRGWEGYVRMVSSERFRDWAWGRPVVVTLAGEVLLSSLDDDVHGMSGLAYLLSTTITVK